MTRFVLVPAFLVLLPAWASPQELGNAAAKEREKKAKAAPPAKPAPAFSNDDLASEKEKKRQKEEAEARGEEPAPEPGPSQESQGQADAEGRKRLSDPDGAKERAKRATSGNAIPESALPEGADPDEVAAARAAFDAQWRVRVDTARTSSGRWRVGSPASRRGSTSCGPASAR
jgi:hypothetical protein